MRAAPSDSSGSTPSRQEHQSGEQPVRGLCGMQSVPEQIGVRVRAAHVLGCEAHHAARDSLTGLLFDIGGFGVERPGLTVNDRYWELFLAD